MAIETAGEQRYYDFIADRIKKHRLMDISCLSIVFAGFIAFTSEADACIFVGLVLIILGVAIAITNTTSKKELSKKLDIVIASHPHSDHIGGMADVINTFSLSCKNTSTFEKDMEYNIHRISGGYCALCSIFDGFPFAWVSMLYRYFRQYGTRI